MTDKELKDAAWVQLTKTADLYPKWKARGFPPATGWGRAKSFLDQIGLAAPPPPPPSPPPPPPTGTLISKLCDTKNNRWSQNLINSGYSDRSLPWFDCTSPGPNWPSLGGRGIEEVSTPHGPGLRFRVTSEMWVKSGGMMALMVDMDNWIDQQAFLGKSYQLSGKIMFPSAGNPNGIPAHSDWNMIIEYHSSLQAVYNQFGIDGLVKRFNFRTYDPSSPRAKYLGPAIQYDRWTDFRYLVKFSYGSDGRMEGDIDGQPVARHSGPTLSQGEVPWLQFGFYSGNIVRNEVLYADLRKV